MGGQDDRQALSVDNSFKNLKGGERGAQGLKITLEFVFSVWRRVGVLGDTIIAGARPQREHEEMGSQAPEKGAISAHEGQESVGEREMG